MDRMHGEMRQNNCGVTDRGTLAAVRLAGQHGAVMRYA